MDVAGLNGDEDNMNIYSESHKSSPVVAMSLLSSRENEFRAALKKSGIKAVPYNPGNRSFEGVVVPSGDVHKARMILKSFA